MTMCTLDECSYIMLDRAASVHSKRVYVGDAEQCITFIVVLPIK
jgi:hypothetical protein